MLSPQLLTFLRALRTRAEQGAVVRWELYGDSDYMLRLPSFTLRLSSRKTEQTHPEGVDVIISPVSKDRPKSRMHVFSGDEGFEDVQALINSAQGRARELDELLDSAVNYVTTSEGAIGIAPTQAALSPPALPSRPTADEADRFFAKIAGRWHLDYGRGQEDVDIDKEGNYRLIGKISGEGVTGQHLRFRFRLLLLECDADFTNVEIAKTELNGRVFQIEVLTVGAKSMVGYAKHDEHSLRYELLK